MIKRLEDLAHDSAAVKSHLMLQMKELNNYVAELVNFGISVSNYGSLRPTISLLISIACTRDHASFERCTFVEEFVPNDKYIGSCQILCNVNCCEGYEARHLDMGSDWKCYRSSYRRKHQTFAPNVGGGECTEK